VKGIQNCSNNGQVLFIGEIVKKNRVRSFKDFLITTTPEKLKFA
jgi:hypothetical protein